MADEAKSIYQQIINDHLNDPYAKRAKIDVVKISIISDIQSGTDTQSALDKLNAFSDYENFPTVLYRIAERYEDAKNMKKPETAYSKVSQLYPTNEYGIRSQIDVQKINAISLINSGNESQIQTIIDKLKNDFKQNPYLSAALFRIAERYEDAKKYDAAEILYGQVSQEFTNSSFAGRAGLNMTKIDIIVSVSSSSEIGLRGGREISCRL